MTQRLAGSLLAVYKGSVNRGASGTRRKCRWHAGVDCRVDATKASFNRCKLGRFICAKATAAAPPPATEFVSSARSRLNRNCVFMATRPARCDRTGRRPESLPSQSRGVFHRRSASWKRRRRRQVVAHLIRLERAPPAATRFVRWARINFVYLYDTIRWRWVTETTGARATPRKLRERERC